MKTLYIAVGAAGAAGALLRFAIGRLVPMGGLLPPPVGTLLINLTGCLVLGWFFTRVNLIRPVSPVLKAAVGAGFIGSFTTFSTFSVETLQLLRGSLWLPACSYVLASVFGGLAASWFGYRLAGGTRLKSFRR